MNLTSDPWIPVLWTSGRTSAVSLTQIFEECPKISDLSVPTHERISLMRLLVCLTQASLGAPLTSDDWDGWGENLESAVPSYLLEHKKHFELLGDGPRFLQSPVKGDKTYPTAQIVFHFATGSTPTLLDHEGEADRDLSPAFIARALLVYQNHFFRDSMGQAKAFKGKKGITGTAIEALHSFLIGQSLRKTILLNCLDEETLQPGHLGKPVWEGGGKTDYLARLVPTPCKLWLADDGKRIMIVPGVQYDAFETSDIREPSTTIIIGKRKGIEPKILRASIGRGIWRDLHCLAVLRKGEMNAPKTFISHLDERDEGRVTFWSGELIKAQKAKILDAVESEFTVPFQLFSPTGQARYQAGVNFSEILSKRLYGAVQTYFDVLDQPPPKRCDWSNPKRQDKIQSAQLGGYGVKAAPTDAAQRHYWNALDQRSSILLDLLEGIGTDTDPMGNLDFGKSDENKNADPWTKAVRTAARAAYEHVCPRQTPRQLQAYAAGLRVLHPIPKKAKSSKNPPTS